MDTKPTIKTVLERIQEMHEEQRQFRSAMEQELSDIKREMRAMSHQIGFIHHDIYNLRGEDEELAERIDRLEVNPNAPTGPRT